MEKARYQAVAEGVFVCASSVKMPATHLDLCSTAIRLKNGKVILISPLNPKKCEYDSLRAIGEVSVIVSPNEFHHLFIQAAKNEFPRAQLWAAPGLEKKRADVPWDRIFVRDDWPFGDELAPLAVAGMPRVNEVVFFHKASRTLVVTDLFFNLGHAQGWGARVIFGLLGTFNRFAMSRFLHLLARDKVAFQSSLKTMLNWDFDRLIVAHGAPIESGAKEKAKHAIETRFGSSFKERVVDAGPS